MGDPNEYAHIATNTKEYIKSYYVYDGSNRMIQAYEARANAKDQEPCLLTTYTYWGLTANVKYMFEANALWSTAFET